MIERGLDIDGYIVVEVLGGGRQGTLYLARHRDTNQQAVVRVARPDERDSRVLHDFAQEAKSLLLAATEVGEIHASSGQRFFIATQPSKVADEPPVERATVPGRPITERLKPVAERAEASKAELVDDDAAALALIRPKGRGLWVAALGVAGAVALGTLGLLSALNSRPATPDVESTPDDTCPSEAWKRQTVSTIATIGAAAQPGVDQAQVDELIRTVSKNVVRASTTLECSSVAKTVEGLASALKALAPKPPVSPPVTAALSPAPATPEPTKPANKSPSAPRPVRVAANDKPAAPQPKNTDSARPAQPKASAGCTPDDAWKRRMNLNLTDVETNANAMTAIEVSRATLELYRDLKTVSTPEQCRAFEIRVERLIQRAIK